MSTSSTSSNQDFSVITKAEGWGISFPPDYIVDGNYLAFGTPMPNGSHACSERVVANWKRNHTKVFAFVEHPEHGLIAVSPKEFEALGLAEVIVRE